MNFLWTIILDSNWNRLVVYEFNIAVLRFHARGQSSACTTYRKCTWESIIAMLTPKSGIVHQIIHRSYIESLIEWSMVSHLESFIELFIESCIKSFIKSFMVSRIKSFIGSYINYSLKRSSDRSSNPSLTHSLFHLTNHVSAQLWKLLTKRFQHDIMWRILQESSEELHEKRYGKPVVELLNRRLLHFISLNDKFFGLSIPRPNS